jgi:hypothetical protein
MKHVVMGASKVLSKVRTGFQDEAGERFLPKQKTASSEPVEPRAESREAKYCAP